MEPTAAGAAAAHFQSGSASDYSTRLSEVWIRERSQPPNSPPDAGIYLHHRVWENLT